MENFIDWLTQHINRDDNLPFIMEKNDIINTVKKIHQIILSEDKTISDGKHYGECTKNKSSCQICLYQIWLDEYKEYCVNFSKRKC